MIVTDLHKRGVYFSYPYQGQMRFSKSTELGGLNVDIVLPLRHNSLESEK